MYLLRIHRLRPKAANQSFTNAVKQVLVTASLVLCSASHCSADQITLTRNIFVLGLTEGGGSGEITFTLFNPVNPPGALMNVQTSVGAAMLLKGDGDDPVAKVAIGKDTCQGQNVPDGKSCTFDVSFDPGELDPEAKGRDSNLWQFTVTASFTVNNAAAFVTNRPQVRVTDPCGTEEAPVRGESTCSITPEPGLGPMWCLAFLVVGSVNTRNWIASSRE